MAAPAQPQPPSDSRPAEQSAVARSIAQNRRDAHSPANESGSAQNEPISPLHGQDDVDEPPTPKAATSTLPLPPMESIGLDNEELKDGTNPWMKVLHSAVDHDDEHVTKVSLARCLTSHERELIRIRDISDRPLVVLCRFSLRYLAPGILYLFVAWIPNHGRIHLHPCCRSHPGIDRMGARRAERRRRNLGQERAWIRRNVGRRRTRSGSASARLAQRENEGEQRKLEQVELVELWRIWDRRRTTGTGGTEDPDGIDHVAPRRRGWAVRRIGRRRAPLASPRARQRVHCDGGKPSWKSTRER